MKLYNIIFIYRNMTILIRNFLNLFTRLIFKKIFFMLNYYILLII
jgi:hypothetical protein